MAEAGKARAATLLLEENARKARVEQLTDRICNEEEARKVADRTLEASILAQEKRTTEVLQGIRDDEDRLARRLELMEERLSKRIDTLEGWVE
jgi:putative heme iron utilization protein